MFTPCRTCDDIPSDQSVAGNEILVPTQDLAGGGMNKKYGYQVQPPVESAKAV